MAACRCLTGSVVRACWSSQPSVHLLEALASAAMTVPALEGGAQIHIAWRLAMLEYRPAELLAHITSPSFVSEWLADPRSQSANLAIMKNVRHGGAVACLAQRGADLQSCVWLQTLLLFETLGDEDAGAGVADHLDAMMTRSPPIPPQPRAAHAVLSEELESLGMEHKLRCVGVQGGGVARAVCDVRPAP